MQLIANQQNEEICFVASIPTLTVKYNKMENIEIEDKADEDSSVGIRKVSVRVYQLVLKTRTTTTR